MYKNIINFSIGGIVYLMIELLWRGYSHWSMFFLGGMCFVITDIINKNITGRKMLPLKLIICSLSITVLEFITGYILNIKLDLNVWDYYDMPYNLMGQICLPYMILWVAISFICIWVNSYFQKRLFID